MGQARLAANGLGVGRGGTQHFFAHYAGECGDSKASSTVRKELAPGFVQNRFIGWMHLQGLLNDPIYL
jgi:hypothetical protein